MKIGIFGGSFNPPHKMHEEIVKELLKELDKIIFVPTGMKYEYKNNLIENQYRYDMLKLITDENDKLDVSTYEFKEEVVYTYQTMDYFKSIYPKDEVYFICGADNLSYVEKWKNAKYLLDNNKFLVIARKTDNLEPILEKLKEYKDHITITNIPPVDISSTEIREYLKNKKYEEVSSYLNPKVLDYIIEKGLYQEDLWEK